MKVLYDHQTFTLQKYGGISRYFYELIKFFNKSTDVNVTTSVLFSNNHYISDKKDVQHVNFLYDKEFRGKQRLFNLLNKPNSILKLKQKNFDIFHPTYYDSYFLKYIGNKPFVLTVYDMIHEKFSDMFLENDKTSEHKKLLCDKATKIIAISHSTKKDLIEIFNIEESKIEVVYLGNSLMVENTIIVNNMLSKKDILFVGSRGAYKDFNRFISGILDTLHNNAELFVFCVGGGKFNDNEIQLFSDLKIKKRVSQYTLDDNKLPSFYKNAELFVFPSLYEGFGIPILEAFACSCPLVCSNTSSLPEIAGNAAEYFDPYDEESISIAIENVLNNSQRKEELRENGKERLKYFSWEQTAKSTKKLYESIIK